MPDWETISLLNEANSLRLQKFWFVPDQSEKGLFVFPFMYDFYDHLRPHSDLIAYFHRFSMISFKNLVVYKSGTRINTCQTPQTPPPDIY